MEMWFVIVVLLCTLALVRSFFSLVFSAANPSLRLPPGPLTVPFIGNLLWLRRSFTDLEPLLKELHARYGPIVTLRIGSRRAIFVADRALAHRALIQNGAVFADRPPVPPTSRAMGQRNVSSSPYGPTWRLLRRNVAAEILHPSRSKSFGPARKWVLDILLARLWSRAENGEAVKVIKDFQRAMFSLLVLMCFGDKLGEKEIERIEEVQQRLLHNFQRFGVLNVWPVLGKIFFRKRWNEFLRFRRDQEEVLLPLIRARKKMKQSREDEHEHVTCYVDSLLGLEVTDEETQQKRKLNETEELSLCSEFLVAGTDTTSTALQWVMANLVKHSRIQEKLYEEIKSVVGEGEKEVKEEELQNMNYLRAVVLEALRRHPPGHFVLPHAATEDAELAGYLIPKNASINFMVAEMGRNPEVWEDPMAFKPERFLDGKGKVVDFDLTGSKEIEMMPFGAGRRICPGLALALLHLQYYVANLVYHFQWTAADGEDVDLSENLEFTVVMKNPLRAHISPRTAQQGSS